VDRKKREKKPTTKQSKTKILQKKGMYNKENVSPPTVHFSF